MCLQIIIQFKTPNDFNDFYKKLVSSFDVLFSKNVLYVWLGNAKKKRVEELIEEFGIKNYVIFEISDESIDNFDDIFIRQWMLEHRREDNVRKFERKHQKELKKMRENIDMANKLIKDRIENAKQKDEVGHFG